MAPYQNPEGKCEEEEEAQHATQTWPTPRTPHPCTTTHQHWQPQQYEYHNQHADSLSRHTPAPLLPTAPPDAQTNASPNMFQVGWFLDDTASRWDGQHPQGDFKRSDTPEPPHGPTRDATPPSITSNQFVTDLNASMVQSVSTPANATGMNHFTRFRANAGASRYMHDDEDIVSVMLLFFEYLKINTGIKSSGAMEAYMTNVKMWHLHHHRLRNDGSRFPQWPHPNPTSCPELASALRDANNFFKEFQLGPGEKTRAHNALPLGTPHPTHSRIGTREIGSHCRHHSHNVDGHPLGRDHGVTEDRPSGHIAHRQPLHSEHQHRGLHGIGQRHPTGTAIGVRQKGRGDPIGATLRSALGHHRKHTPSHRRPPSFSTPLLGRQWTPPHLPKRVPCNKNRMQSDRGTRWRVWRPLRPHLHGHTQTLPRRQRGRNHEQGAVEIRLMVCLRKPTVNKSIRQRRRPTRIQDSGPRHLLGPIPQPPGIYTHVNPHHNSRFFSIPQSLLTRQHLAS